MKTDNLQPETVASAEAKPDSPATYGSVEGEGVREAFKAYVRGIQTHQRPQWPEHESIVLAGLHQHKYTKTFGCVIGVDFDENSVTVWFDLCRRWTGTKQDFNAQFSDVIVPPNDQAQRPPPETPGRLQQSLPNYPNRSTAQRGCRSLHPAGSASFMEQNQTMIAGVIMTVVGAIMSDSGLSASGAFIISACGFINSRRHKRTPND